MYEDKNNLLNIATKFRVNVSTVLLWIKNKEILREENRKQTEVDDVIITGTSLNENLNKQNKDDQIERVCTKTLDEKLEAIKMSENGISIKEIAQKCKTSVALVTYWIKHKEVLKMSKSCGDVNKVTIIRTVKEKLAAIEMHENGFSLKEIADKYDTSVALVTYWIKQKNKFMGKLNTSCSDETKNMDNSNNLKETKSKIENFKRPANVMDSKVRKSKRGKIEIEDNLIRENSSQPENESKGSNEITSGDTVKEEHRFDFENNKNNLDSNGFPKNKNINEKTDLKNKIKEVYQNLYINEYFLIKEIFKNHLRTSEDLANMITEASDLSRDEAIDVAKETEAKLTFLKSDYFNKISERYSYLQNLFSDNTNIK